MKHILFRLGLLAGITASLAASVLFAQAPTLTAVATLQKAAEQGDVSAQRRLGQAYEKGENVRADMDQAEHWYGKAAASGDIEAMGHYGRLLFGKSHAAGLPWLIKAADRGDAKAAYIAGIALFNGDGGPKDWPAAYAYLSFAVEAGQASAQSSLTRMTSLLTPLQRDAGITRLQTIKASVAAANATRATSTSHTRAATTEKSRSVATTSGARGAPGAGDHYVQLGAFSNASIAQSAWSKFESRVRPFAGDRRPQFIPVGKIVRLRLQGFDRQSAERLCRAMVSSGTECFAGRQQNGNPR